MHRVGCAPGDAVALARQVLDAPHLELEALWTHCAVADEPDNPFTDAQIDRFEAVVAELAAAGASVGMRHVANTAAGIAHPRSRMDLVRAGIGIYGIVPSDAVGGDVDLRPALRLVAEVSHVQRVPAGDGISYGLRHHVERDTVVATVPIGYADGVVRSLGTGRAEVLIGGRRCPMVGVVTMDQLMVDCGPDARVAPGDEVVLLGAQESEVVGPADWARMLGTIPYEVVCGIGPRVPRLFHRGDDRRQVVR
jgi:alanine racemase